MSPRTFNNYFPSKEAAIVAGGTDRAGRMRDALRARRADEPLWTALGCALTEAFPTDEPDREWVAKARLIKATPALQVEQQRSDNVTRAMLAEEIARRTGTDVDRDLYPSLAAAAVVSAVRRSGRSYQVPVRIASWNGQRYVVSVQGESQWARNLRAAGTADLLVGTSVEPVAARELLADEKEPFLAWYCHQPEHRLSVRYGFKVGPGNLSQGELDPGSTMRRGRLRRPLCGPSALTGSRRRRSRGARRGG